MAIGPLEWDFGSVLGARRLGWVSDEDWQAFCNGYGSDLSEKDGMDLLAEVLAFRRCCWLASTTRRHSSDVERARHRIATLTLPLGQRQW